MWLGNVNEARHRLFTSYKTLEITPHSQAAMFEHVKRALLHTSFYRKQATSVHKKNLDFRECGGKTNTIVFWLPYWTTFEDARNLAPSFYTAAAKCLEHEPVELESAAQGCVHVKVDMCK